jgi:uncharacterized protein with HEPN domain
MQHDDRVYLQHVLGAIERVEEYTKGMDEQAFGEQHLVQDAVFRQISWCNETSQS